LRLQRGLLDKRTRFFQNAVKGFSVPGMNSPTAVILIGCFASLALADDFKTINGKEYKNVTVSRVEADGIVLKSKSGISKVYFTELPKDVQTRFHYDPERAYSEQQKAKLKGAWNQQGRGVAVEPMATSTRVPVGPTKWTYSEHQDEMGRGTTKLAQVGSSNTVHLGFPYGGETRAALQLRRSPKFGQDAMLRVERGQFVSSYTNDSITARFDDGELWKFKVDEPVESTTGLLFIRENEDFINQLRNAKTVKIEADFFQEGPRVFEFDVRGLNW
jgi:hypothetical protein